MEEMSLANKFYQYISVSFFKQFDRIFINIEFFKSDIYVFANQMQAFHLREYHISVAEFLVSQVYLFFQILQVNHVLSNLIYKENHMMILSFLFNIYMYTSGKIFNTDLILRSSLFTPVSGGLFTHKSHISHYRQKSHSETVDDRSTKKQRRRTGLPLYTDTAQTSFLIHQTTAWRSTAPPYPEGL